MRVKPFFKKKYASNQIETSAQIETSNQIEMFHDVTNVPRSKKIIEKKVDRTKKIFIL